jgi:hypothetical protein
MLKIGTIKSNVLIDMAAFVLLMITVVFGWGWRKNIQVLDLRSIQRDEQSRK